MGKGDIFRNIANVVATPFRYIGVKVSESVDGFSRYFKKRCGESPLRYRKRMKTVDLGAEPEITPVKKQWTVDN